MIKETDGYESQWKFHIPVIILILTDFSHQLIDELANPYTRYSNDDLPRHWRSCASIYASSFSALRVFLSSILYRCPASLHVRGALRLLLRFVPH
jgi:hypothetical protein